MYSFNPKQEKFFNYRHQPGNSNSVAYGDVNQVQADANGMIWLATQNALDKFDPSTKTFTHFRHNENDTTSVHSNRVVTFVKDEHNPEILWLVDRNTLGLDCFNSKTGKVIRHFNFPFSRWLYSSYLQELQKDNPPIFVQGMKNGNIWMGSNDNGIFRFNAINQQFVFIPTFRKCYSSAHLYGFHPVKEDDTGNLWTVNDNNEVVYYDMAAKNFFLSPHQTQQYTVHGDSISNIPGQEP